MEPTKAIFKRLVVQGDVGAVLPRPDSVDRRMLREVMEGGGRIIDSQRRVGGWPNLSSSAKPPADGDRDGMPDAWEAANGLDPADRSDGPKDYDGDGYTNVEEYLNGTRPSASR